MRLIAFIFLLVLGIPFRAEAGAPQIEAGILDLREWNPEELPAFPLQGTVEFHWERFITQDGPSERPALLPIPAPWDKEGPYPIHGYGSYRLQILLKEPRRIAFYFSPLWSASRIIIDGDTVRTSGRPGRDAEHAEGDLGDFFEYSFIPQSSRLEIIFEISNFDLFQGGITEPVFMGTPKAIQNRAYRGVGTGAFLIGILLIMSFYHFGLFFLRRSDRSPFFYGLVCLGVALHMIMGDPSDTISLVRPMTFLQRVLFYNIGWVIGVAAFVYYCNGLFPRESPKRLAQVLGLVSALYCLVISFLPMPLLIAATPFYQLLSVVVFLCELVAISLAVKRRRESAGVFLLSFLILIGCAINDMFFRRGSISDIPIIGVGLFIFTFCQSYLLSARFSKAFLRAETSEAAVRDLNQNLEFRVEEQTRDIKSIMQHIRLGIFTISGEQASIGRDYSQHLENLLADQNLTDRSALPLLFHKSGLTQDAQHQVASALVAAAGEPSINFDLNADVYPRQMLWQHPTLGERIYDLSWNPIITDEDRIDKILVTVGDVTDLKNMEKQTRELQSELKIVAEILNVRDEDFRRFVKISRSFLDQNSTLVDAADPGIRDAETLKVIFMNLHTLKGVARSLEFRQLSDMIHTMEQFYSRLAKQDGETWEPDQIRQDMRALSTHIAEYEAIAQSKLGRLLDESARLILPAPQALESFSSLAAMLNTADADRIKQIEPLMEALQKTLFVSLRDTFQDIFHYTRALAKDLEKPEPAVFLDIPALQISTKTDELLRNAFLHLLRNAMDHGIERPKDRLLAGKAAAGLIHLRMENTGEFMQLLLSDDGHGLNVRRLKQLGVQCGLWAADAPVSWQTVAELIFAAGVSTAQTVTGLSGRGIGMPAVKRFMEELGGSTGIDLQEKEPDAEGYIPFHLIIQLPMSLFYSNTAAGSMEGAA